jgi:hypothetical protein
MKQLVTFCSILLVTSTRVSSVWAAVYNGGGGVGTGGALNRVLDKYIWSMSGGTCGTGSITDIFCIITNIINKLLTVGGFIALLFLVIGGIQYMASGGDEKALTTAKGTITYSVLGLLIMLGSILIINTLLYQLGL